MCRLTRKLHAFWSQDMWRPSNSLADVRGCPTAPEGFRQPLFLCFCLVAAVLNVCVRARACVCVRACVRDTLRTPGRGIFFLVDMFFSLFVFLLKKCQPPTTVGYSTTAGGWPLSVVRYPINVQNHWFDFEQGVTKILKLSN